MKTSHSLWKMVHGKSVGYVPCIMNFILLLALVFSGCGYSATRLLPARYQTIYVEPIQNQIKLNQEVSENFSFQTYLPGLEEKIMQGIINRFLFDGNLRVTTKSEQADIILSGEMTEFSRQPLRRSDSNTVDEYRLNLGFYVTARDRDGNYLFKGERIVGDTTYFTTGPSARNESSVVDDMIVDAARRVVERVIENW